MKKLIYFLLTLLVFLQHVSGVEVSDRFKNPEIIEAFFDGIINTHMKSNNSPSTGIYWDLIISKKNRTRQRILLFYHLESSYDYLYK
ncbi:MAG: hypothetical protein QF823_02325 [Candidatus Marinimicrobia bacterium]|jgi:hypothetical protein|nr:hypothetical protein [Candidatus Neomarinimicrobiota bacterium]|tara:strand:+ start:11496 stop:11756 length:261 start_codon:yes stop_codon:yes gene_type:complete